MHDKRGTQAWAMGILEQAVNKPGLWSRGRPSLYPQTTNATLTGDQGKSRGALCTGALGYTGEPQLPSHSRPTSSGHGEGRSGSALGTFSFRDLCLSLPSPLTLRAAHSFGQSFFFKI